MIHLSTNPQTKGTTVDYTYAGALARAKARNVAHAARDEREIAAARAHSDRADISDARIAVLRARTFHGYGSTCPDCVRNNYVAVQMGWAQRGCRS